MRTEKFGACVSARPRHLLSAPTLSKAEDGRFSLHTAEYCLKYFEARVLLV